MQTVIICNQKTQGLEPVTSGTPLPLCEVADKPVLSHIASNLKFYGIISAEVVLPERNGGLLSRLEELSQGIELIPRLLSDENQLRILRRLWNGGDILCINCDHLDFFDLSQLMEYHMEKRSLFTAAVAETFYPWEGVAVTLDGAEKDGRITNIQACPSVENCSTNFAAAGVYIVSKELLSAVSPEEGTGLWEYISAKLSQGEKSFFGITPKGWYKRLAKAEDFLNCNLELVGGAEGFSLKDREISEGIYGESVKGLRGVSMIPPVYIGKNVSAGMGTVLGPGAVICDNATLGERCYVKNSYVGEEVRTGNEVTLSGAVVCRGSQLKKGVECEKMAVIGARTTIGENTLVRSGARVWDGKMISSDITVSGDVREMYDGKLCFDDEGALSDLSGFLSPQVCSSLGMAAGTYLDKGSLVVAAHSGTLCARALCDAVAAGLSASGVNVWVLGEAMRGQLYSAMNSSDAALGVMVTADVCAAVSLFDKGGLKLTSAGETEIEQRLNLVNFRYAGTSGFGRVADASSLKELYLRRLENMLPGKLRGANIRVKTSDKFTAEAADRLFHGINDLSGEEVIFHINPENGSCSCYTENTGYVFHEKLVMAALEKNFEKGMTAAVPDTFPDALEEFAKARGEKVLRYMHTSEGDADAAAREAAALSCNLFVRDPLELAVRIAARLSGEKKTLKQLIKPLPEFYSAQRFITAKLSSPEVLRQLKGSVKGENSRAVVRPVKRGTGLMIFAQAHKAEAAAALCDEIERRIKKMKN